MKNCIIKCLTEKELELDKYYTVRGLRAIYEISEDIIYQAIHSEELSAFKNCIIDKYGKKHIINKWYIEENEALKNFIEKNKNN